MPQHDGCADCGTTDVPVLYSILKSLINPISGKSVSPNKAVCPPCAKKYGIDVEAQ